MTMEVQLIDAASGEVVRNKSLSSVNNPIAAAWSWGSSDRSIPNDMGIILAEYILTVVPAATKETTP